MPPLNPDATDLALTDPPGREVAWIVLRIDPEREPIRRSWIFSAHPTNFRFTSYSCCYDYG